MTLSAPIMNFKIHPEIERLLPPIAKQNGDNDRVCLNTALRVSIGEHGLLEPVEVIEGDGGVLLIINGGRRYEQAKAAGLTSLPYRIWSGDASQLRRLIAEEALVSRSLTVGQRILLVLEHFAEAEKDHERTELSADPVPDGEERDKFVPLGRWRKRLADRFGLSETYLKEVNKHLFPEPTVENFEVRRQFAVRARENLWVGNWNPHQAEKEYQALFEKRKVVAKKQEKPSEATDAGAAGGGPASTATQGSGDDDELRLRYAKMSSQFEERCDDYAREKNRADELEDAVAIRGSMLLQAHTLIGELFRHAQAPDEITGGRWRLAIADFEGWLREAGVLIVELETQELNQDALHG